jgi:hypothetical protein
MRVLTFNSSYLLSPSTANVTAEIELISGLVGVRFASGRAPAATRFPLL